MREDERVELEHTLPDARPIQYTKAPPSFHYENEEGNRFARRLLLYGVSMAFVLIGIPTLIFFLRNQIAPYMNVNEPGGITTGSGQAKISMKEFRDSGMSYSFSYPVSWVQGQGEMIDGGCNITFTDPSNDAFWVSICGLYVNPLESIENLARFHSASGTALVREEITAGGKRAVRQDVVVSGDTEYSYTISYFIADVPAESIGMTTINGILAIHMRVTDRSQVDRLKSEFAAMMDTFTVEDSQSQELISTITPPPSTPLEEGSSFEPPSN